MAMLNINNGKITLIEYLVTLLWLVLSHANDFV